MLRLVPYGPPATDALRVAIAGAKGDDALAPVTVAVPSNYAGLALRRALGREGLVNVRFLVLARVAELLGAPALAAQSRRPLTGTVRAEAVRSAVAGDPGPFAEVATHTATERALESTFRDLRPASERALAAVARAGGRAAHVVRLYRDVRARTQAYYDEEELAGAAAGAVGAGTAAQRDVGHLVLFLPRRLSPAELTLIESLANADGLTAILGLTGDPDADGPARRLAERLARALGAPDETPAGDLPSGSSIVAGSDAEEEVRTAIRTVMDRLAAGTPLHRIAVLYTVTQPYALLAHEQFQAAGVPHNGPAVRTLAQTMPGRTLLGMLRLRERGFRRDDVMDWLSAAPVLEQAGGRRAPAQRWDLLSRSAGVVGGVEQWQERLSRHRRSLETKRDAREASAEADEWELTRLRSDIEQLAALERFIDELARRLLPGRRSTWHEFGAWARELLARYLPEGARWPDEELEAHRDVEAALHALANLGDVRRRTDEATFHRALERELEAPAARIGRFGDGVFIGRLRDAMGCDFDLAVVLGMTEGMIPSRGRDDPLLPDREREQADDVPLRTDRLAEERRDYLAALASANERILVYPRADLRGQRGHLPARWLLESASRLAGRRVFSGNLDGLGPVPWFAPVASFQSALGDGLTPASEQEYDLRSLLRSGVGAHDHYLAAGDPALRAGLDAARSRSGAGMTRWDGLVGAHDELAPTAERAISPTALQHWAACPYRYFLGHVLRVSDTERPEDALRLTPIERGNLIHRALETFIHDAPPRTSPDEPWSAEERAELRAIGERLCNAAEASGLTGRRLLWRIERARVLRDLAGFLDADEQMRRELRVVPHEVELSFGLPDSEQPPSSVTLASGATIAFRGRVDRVDRAPDGSRIVVLDYKTGATTPYDAMRKSPLKHGQLLQLPIYALAARDAYGDASVAAYYWFASEQRDYDLRGYEVDDEKLDDFRNTLALIVGGIGSGVFPARPGNPTGEGGYENCNICPFDRLCPRDRETRWERKRRAPELRSYVGLAEE